MRVIVSHSYFVKDLVSDGKQYVKKTNDTVIAYPLEWNCIIRTLDGDMKAKKGDYIIIGTHKEIYPCRKDIFEEIYEVLKNG